MVGPRQLRRSMLPNTLSISPKHMVDCLTKEDATIIRDHALKAIEELMALVYISKDKCSAEQHQQIERAVGLSIGQIQMDILEVLNVAYPELDDLTDSTGGPVN